MTPRLLVKAKMKGFNRLLRRLLRRETGPLVPPGRSGVLRLLQITGRLSQPVLRPVCHRIDLSLGRSFRLAIQAGGHYKTIKFWGWGALVACFINTVTKLVLSP